jgi:hypothetical protein
MPMTPFIGVRISWLMFARNSLLARLLSSARAVASARAAVRSRTFRSRSTVMAVMRPRIDAKSSASAAISAGAAGSIGGSGASASRAENAFSDRVSCSSGETTRPETIWAQTIERAMAPMTSSMVVR